MRAILSGPDYGFTGGDDEPSEVDVPNTSVTKLDVPTCGWIKFEVVPGVWVEVSTSEWADVVITREKG